MQGQLSHELEVNVPASEVWEVYGTLKIVTLMCELLPGATDEVIVEGDGGIGTVMKVTLPLGGYYYKKVCTKLDNEKRMTESELMEGGYLELGFRQYRVRYEILEKDAASSIIKSTIEYEIEEECASNVCLVTIKPFEVIAKVIGKYLFEKNAATNVRDKAYDDDDDDDNNNNNNNGN